MKSLAVFYAIFLSLFFNTPPLYAKELILPEPNGICSVGTQAIELQDPSRLMLRGGAMRRWMVQIFYPSTPRHIGTYPYMPGTLENGIVERKKVMSFAKPNTLPFMSRKFPLIIAILGRGEERQKATILYEELISQGYTIIAMDQPYLTNFVKFLLANLFCSSEA